MIMVEGKNVALAGGAATVLGIVLFYGTAIFGAAANQGNYDQVNNSGGIGWVTIATILIGLGGLEIMLAGILLWARDGKRHRSDP